MRILIVITIKSLKSFFKEGREGRVNNLSSSERDVKFGSLIKNGKLFDVSPTER